MKKQEGWRGKARTMRPMLYRPRLQPVHINLSPGDTYTTPLLSGIDWWLLNSGTFRSILFSLLAIYTRHERLYYVSSTGCLSFMPITRRQIRLTRILLLEALVKHELCSLTGIVTLIWANRIHPSLTTHQLFCFLTFILLFLCRIYLMLFFFSFSGEYFIVHIWHI